MKIWGDVERVLPVKDMIKIDFVKKSKVEKILSKQKVVSNIPSAFGQGHIGPF